MAIAADNAAAVAEMILLAGEEALGFPPLLLNGEPFPAHVEEMTYDDVLAAGGTAEGGGFEAVIATASLAGQPAKGTPIEARGMSLWVLEARRNLAHWVIKAGDPVEEE